MPSKKDDLLTVFFSVESSKSSLAEGESKNGDAISPVISTKDGKSSRDGKPDQSYRTFRSTETLAEETNISLKDETRLPVQGEPDNNVDLYCETHGKTNMNHCLGLVLGTDGL